MLDLSILSGLELPPFLPGETVERVPQDSRFDDVYYDQNGQPLTHLADLGFGAAEAWMKSFRQTDAAWLKTALTRDGHAPGGPYLLSGRDPGQLSRRLAASLGTMIEVDGSWATFQVRYSTAAAARQAHDRIVAALSC